MIGLIAAWAMIQVRASGGCSTPLASGPLLSDSDGALQELVLQYEPGSAEIVTAAYRQFLAQLPEDVTVHLLCSDASACESLVAGLGPVPPRLEPHAADHPITAWSRDRWLPLAPAAPDAPTTLLRARSEDGAEVWPVRAGDRRVAEDLSAMLDGVEWRTSLLMFDGGDFVADDRNALVGEWVLRKNPGIAERDLLAGLQASLGRPAVLLRGAPIHHAGMFVMTAGRGRVLVGDPALAQPLAGRIDLPAVGADFSEATRARFEAVAAACREAGYQVTRIPVVPGRDGRTYLTYTNVILDQRDGRRVVYLPTYRGADALNDAGAAVWQGLGFEVRRVDCTDAYTHFGSLRCLVSVLRRVSPSRTAA